MRTIASMTTAAAESPAEMRVVAAIRALKAARRMGTDEILTRAHMSRSTWYERMRDGRFTIGEVITLAEIFSVSVQDLVDGRVTLPNSRRNLRALPGGLRERATYQQLPLTNSVATIPTRHTRSKSN